MITGLKPGEDGTWTVRIPEAKDGKWSFRELFVSGRRAQRARHPNEGFLRVQKVGPDRRTSFEFRQADLRSHSDVGDIELVFLHDWSISRVPVKSIDEATRTLTVQHQIGGPSRWAVMDWFEKQPRYFLENSIEFLGAPGEWFLDQEDDALPEEPYP